MQLLPREARSATPTEVESEGDGFVIRRRYDVDLQALAPVAHDYFIEAPSHVGLVLPSSRSVSIWEWRSPHGTTLAALLAPPNFSMGATFTTAFGEIGASLRTLHEVPRQGIEVPAELVRRPTSLLRTSAWVDRTWGNARAKAALEQLEARLSPLEGHAVQDAVHGVQASFVGDVAVVQGWVVSLGGLSLANVLTTPGDPRFGWAILSGPDNCLGPAEYDIGFVLGELAEHAFVCAAAGVPGDDFAQLAASFLSGYGTVLDPALVAAVTVFRVLLHILDFSHFVGEIDDWYMYAELMRVLVDSPLGWIPGL